MVRVPAPVRPATAGPRINQEFEGHGLLAPAPCDRGFRRDIERPASSVGERTRAAAAALEAEGGRSRKGKKGSGVPTVTIFAHVREKTISVPCGVGAQKVYWLGATAVHRYLTQPHSYSAAFSRELTPKAVIAEDGAQLPRAAHVCDELNDGDHVWIDVGDGTPISRVMSRSFPDRMLFEPAPDQDFQEKLGWGATAPDLLDDEVIGIDPRQTMSYERTVAQKKDTFKEWHDALPAAVQSQEGLFDEFAATWQRVHVDDLAGSTSWMNDLKLSLFGHFEQIKYLFSSHATPHGEGPTTIALSELWAICKRCHLTSPLCNLAKINQMVANKAPDAHWGGRRLTLPDFMGALVRISVFREKGSAADKLPGCMVKMIEENLLVLTPGFDTFDRAKARPSVFASSAVRHKLTIHETHLKSLFSKWATSDDSRQTMQLDEWIELNVAAKTTGVDLNEAKVVEAFVAALVGERPDALQLWEEAGDAACKELIFPEFVDAIQRAAMLKFDTDHKTPVDLKIHEMCLLLIFGPAGPLVAPPARSAVPPALAGVERRVSALGM